MWCRVLITRARAEENFSPEEHESDSTNSQHFFLNLEFCAKILGYDKHRVHCFFFGSHSDNAFYQNQKCWLWLKSKSIPKVNSSILKVFEPKLSIFVKHQYPSFFHIIMKKCCNLGFVIWQYFCGLFFPH